MKSIESIDNTTKSIGEFDSINYGSSEHPKYGRLALGALRALPASSAPVQHVFSYGGIFMRPHRVVECQKQHCQHWCFLNATVVNSLNCFESLYLLLYFRITSAEATLS